jgi:hypothetical protein
MILYGNTYTKDNLVTEIVDETFEFCLDLVDQCLVTTKLDRIR